MWWFIPAFAWMFMIFYLSAQPTLPGSSAVAVDFFTKKLAHIGVYGALMFWMIFGFTSGFRRKSSNKQLVLALILTIAYACFDELHQSTVIGRTGTLRDVGYDALGAGICYLVFKRVI